MARLTDSDKVWLAGNHSSLVILERPNYSLVEGRMYFHRTYNGVSIEDDYAIRLELPVNDEQLPRLTETGSRLKAVLNNHPEFRGNLAELHIYPSERLCLGAPQDLRLNYLPNPSSELLFEHYIMPYFYSQSYFERYGRWPWRHLPHNSRGIITWYAENSHIRGAIRETIRSLKKLAEDNNPGAQQIIDRAMRHDSFSPSGKCLCGSGKRQAACHRVFTKLALALRYSGG